MVTSSSFPLHLSSKHVNLLKHFSASWIALGKDMYSSNGKRNINALGVHNVDTGLNIAF